MFSLLGKLTLFFFFKSPQGWDVIFAVRFFFSVTWVLPHGLFMLHESCLSDEEVTLGHLSGYLELQNAQVHDEVTVMHTHPP